jgi:outer membrane immunogenic protein
MRRFATLLLGTTSLIAFADVGFAADMAPRMVPKAPVAVPVAAFSWTGCYIGGHIGGGWGRKDLSKGEAFPLVSGFHDEIDGFLGGVQSGCDYQFDRNWVIGIEGQFSWSNIKGSFSADPFFSVKGFGAVAFTAKTDWITTLTGRVGYTVDRWMIYGKGGVAWARDKYSLVPSSGFTAAGTETRAGWTAGVGFEYAFWNSWSAKLEYNYMDFGNKRVALLGPDTVDFDIDQKIHAVKFGINYRFNAGAGGLR